MGIFSFFRKKPLTAGGNDNEHHTVMLQRDNRGTVVLFDGPSRLFIQDTERPDKKWDVPVKNEIVAGYSDDCDVVINYDETVSGRHCCFFRQEGRIYMENLSTVNPAIADGSKVEGRVMLFSGECIILGRVRLKVEFM